MRAPLVFCIIFSFFIATISYAQNGTIRGIVFDGANGELLPGVTIVVEGTTTGTITDLDGKFNLSIKPGIYNINISYISYEPINISGVEVKAGEVTVLDEMGLKEATFEIAAATVTAARVRNTETALTAIKRKSPNVLDGISAAKLRKTGDSDAASAMKRVTGVSVSGGKYVFVRGLGDRYTKTTLNGVDIPGLDPDRNTLQMDIFPTNVIDNLIVNKTFSADLPADFTGGLIDIGIKDFPNTKIGSISLGAEYNPNFHFNSNFVTYDGGNTDWLGFDDGTRDNPITDPSIIDLTSTINIDSEVGQQYSAALRSFSSTMAAKKEQNLMNANLGFSLGNQFAREKVTLGYNLAFSYKSETEFYEDALDSKYILDNDQSITELNNSDYQNGPLGISNTFIGGLGGFAIKTQKAKFRLNFLHLQNGESTAGMFFKSKNNEGSGFEEGLQHNLEYNQRQLTNLLIDGKHVYSESGWTFEWKLSPTLSKLSDPDIRMTQYKIEDGEYEIDGGENDKPARIWRELTEISATGLFHITKEFKLFERKSKFKFGGLYTYKQRDFLIETFKFNIRGVDFTGNPDELFYEENLWPYQGTQVNNGVTVEQNFDPINTNDFDANANNIAGYVKTEINPLANLKTTLGLRVEKFEQYYTGETSEIKLDNEKVLDDMNFFPEVNIIYSITPKMNLRASFSQTIARPSFKELSYAQIEDPISGVTFNGGLYTATQGGWDGNLTSTTIQNYDLRWEMYFEGGQMVSVSGFYKNFKNPIEIVMYSGSSAVNVQPRNVGNGTVLGVETEFRLNLGSIAEVLSPVSISSNLTLLTSEIDRDPAEYEQKVNNARDGETIEKTRIMAGMSPYIVNAGLSYLGKKGFFEELEAGLYYNVQGESLEINGVDDRPDVYSVPFHSLNFTASKSFGGNKQYSLGIKIKNILDNKKEMVFRSYGSEDMIYQSRTTGRSFGLNLKYNF